MRLLPWVLSFVTLAECGPRVSTPPRTAARPPATRVSRLDSATIERLCEQPDSVRAGTKDCVLKDQTYQQTRRPMRKPPR